MYIWLLLVLWWERRKLSPAEKTEVKKRHREFLRRYAANDPMGFPKVDGTVGTPVGEPLVVGHFTLHDMAPHAIFGEMTFQVLVKGLRANAWQLIGFERTDGMFAETTIQPVWVNFTYHLSDMGQPFCGFSSNMPPDWPSGHQRVWEVSECNCPDCRTAANSVAATA